MQKIMTCNTATLSLRAKIEGWSMEDGDKVSEAFVERIDTPNHYHHINDMPVGLIGGMVRNIGMLPPTILHALGQGWKLLSSPTLQEDTTYEWWLVKD
jgi:hypothetical protein